MFKIQINSKNYTLDKSYTVLEVCKMLGIKIPHFCYHEKLSIAGNCRMCLVEAIKPQRPDFVVPVVACVESISNNLSIWTNSPFAMKARENVLETLLINHPLDCPICDQGGECDLQDKAKMFGSSRNKFYFNKRGVEDKNFTPVIKTIMSRCIHCTRCVRFMTEVAGVQDLGVFNRGTSTEIGTFLASKPFNSEVSGNIIDLCPVGALTAKAYTFKSRAWELRTTESIDLLDGLGSNIYINFKGLKVTRIIPKNNHLINEYWISDKIRFSYDALTHNRLKSISLNFGSSPFFLLNKDAWVASKKGTSWMVFFKNFSLNVLLGKRICLVLSETLDLKTLILFTLLNRVSLLNSIKSRAVQGSDVFTNLSLTLGCDRVSNISNSQCQSAFIFGCNTKLESAILNTRIREYSLESNIKIFAFSNSFKSNFPVSFKSLSLLNFFLLFESKDFVLSKKLMYFKQSLFIFGESFLSRYSNFNFLSYLIKKILPFSLVYNIVLNANSVGLRLLKLLKPLNKKDLKSYDFLFCFGLTDLISVRRVLSEFKKKLTTVVFWFGSHKIFCKGLIDGFFPILTLFEDSGTFINLEGRPQKAEQAIVVEGEQKVVYPIKSIIKKLLTLLVGSNNIIPTPKFSNITNFLFINYLLELIKVPVLFETLEKCAGLMSLKTIFVPQFSFNKYPFKAQIFDFYLGGNFARYSPIMSKSSQNARLLSSNFSN